MRIPTSVVVMSLATAVPFGLGVRDTLSHPDGSADEFGSGLGLRSRTARDRSRELEEYEAEAEREQIERETAELTRAATLDQLLGARPGTMGALFEGITLGADAGSFQSETVRQRLEHATQDHSFWVEFDADATSLNAVVVRLDDSGVECGKLGDKLIATWGSTPTRAWLDAATHQRATFDSDTCRLRFDRYLEPTDWVARLPLEAIGTRVDRFVEQVGPSAKSDEDGGYWFWSIPGIGNGKGDTVLEAYTAKRKIVGFKAVVVTDFESTLAVRDALAEKLAAEPHDTTLDEHGDIKTWDWKRRIPMSLGKSDPDHLTRTNRISLLVGNVP